MNEETMIAPGIDGIISHSHIPYLGALVIGALPSLQKRSFKSSSDLLESNLEIHGGVPLGQKGDVGLVAAKPFYARLRRAKT